MKKVKGKIDYRHFICVAITLLFVLLAIFVFPSALGRLIESVRDFGLSVAFYFCKMFGIENSVTVTVNDLPKMPFFDVPNMPSSPVPSLPETFDGFKFKWHEYWKLVITARNMVGYLDLLGSLIAVLANVVLYIIPIIIIVYIAMKQVLDKQNNDYNVDSKALKIVRRISDKTYMPVKSWLIDFVSFVKDNKAYYILWAVIWAYNFNLFTIVVEFFAFYLYFAVSWDVVHIYRQVYKLLIDLWTPFNFIPWYVWCVIALVVFDYIRKKIGFAVLNHNEMKNRGFINERPIVFMGCGTMGKKKTTFITDVALSQEVMFRDKAFEKILENDLKFPNFPWINFENAIKSAMANHTVYNLATCKRFVARVKYAYEYSEYSSVTIRKCFRRHLTKLYGYCFDNEFLFGYDFERYGMFYDDKLKVTSIWETLETYAQLYFIYVTQSSLLISNYSVRVDNVLSDLGNFPLWHSDFFQTDSRLMDSYSRHAHILDFDSLRLGRKVLENNANSNNFEFGVVLVTEIGKERGNNLENIEKKKSDSEANPKNDYFDDWLKMVRHSATVDNFPFVRVITDEQRPTSWGANARDLTDIVYIEESSDERLSMPFFALEELLYDWVFSKFVRLYENYRYQRGDNTLTMHILKGIVAKIHTRYKRIHNQFGYCQLSVQVESGTMDGQRKNCKYYLSTKKIYSKRFSTDCFSDFFVKKALRSPIGINDLDEYETEKATFVELAEQNSYFVAKLVTGFTFQEQ